MKKIIVNTKIYEVFKRYEVPAVNKKLFQQHVLEFLSFLYVKTIVNKKINHKNYVSISVENIREIVSKRVVSNLLEYLVNASVIEINNNYSNRKKSSFTRSYRIKPFYRYGHFEIIDSKREHDPTERLYSENAKYQIDSINTFVFEAPKRINNLQDAVVAALALNKNREWSVDKNGRVYHSITNLPKKYRSLFIEDLVSIDISSSSWQFMTIYLSHKGIHLPELERIIRRGKLYDHIAEKMGLYRDGVKRRAFIELFSDYSKEDLQIRQYLQSQFNLFSVQKGLGDNKFLANQLMKLEVDYIQSSVMPELMKRDIPAFTIHDCVVVKKSDSMRVQRIMNEVSEEKYGYVIPTKLSDFQNRTEIRKLFTSVFVKIKFKDAISNSPLNHCFQKLQLSRYESPSAVLDG